MESGATFAPGKVGQAFSFSGLPDDGGISLGNVPAFDFTPDSSFTMEAWINSVGPTIARNDGQTIISLNSKCAATVQILGISAGERVDFAVRDVNLKGAGVMAPEPLSKNTWQCDTKGGLM